MFNEKGRTKADKAAEDRGWAMYQWHPGDKVQYTMSGTHSIHGAKHHGVVVDCRPCVGCNCVHVEDGGKVYKLAGDRVRPETQAQKGGKARA